MSSVNDTVWIDGMDEGHADTVAYSGNTVGLSEGMRVHHVPRGEYGLWPN